MHASTLVVYQKRYLRYIPIYDITERAPTQKLKDNRKGEFCGRVEISKYYMSIGSYQKME